ncbi:MAG: hypothetical protein NXH81_04035 [Halieaceae bacterium]|uniref:hypothetical protein n=1 Tax=Haliea alexandrii TaxID=2448162 RepID=UPI001304B55F|nr:hypothetical protein [Haliea alexandrii]MCR9184549.1 hypothetical protein [Halieaceae bacterium]
MKPVLHSWQRQGAGLSMHLAGPEESSAATLSRAARIITEACAKTPLRKPPFALFPHIRAALRREPQEFLG